LTIVDHLFMQGTYININNKEEDEKQQSHKRYNLVIYNFSKRAIYCELI
jgi:hypothetical protein